jgi:hypothetical protein
VNLRRLGPALGAAALALLITLGTGTAHADKPASAVGIAKKTLLL